MVDHDSQATPPTPQGQAETGRDGAAHDGDRVAKALARAGVASRREVERLIGEGRVALNGRVLDTPAVKVAPGDILTVDGAVVAEREPTRLWRYHKPVGLVTTNADPRGRPTVFQALPADLPRVISVGRLDLNSEGLLLLTNDGALARALELPATGWIRRYRVRAYGRTSQAALDALRDGITVEGVVYGPIEARLDKVQHKGGRNGGGRNVGGRNGGDRHGGDRHGGDRDGPGRDGAGDPSDAPANVWISVALTEGKNREVRRVLEALGLKVNRLVRLAYGPFALATLVSGAVEEVGPRVIREQLSGLLPPEALPQGNATPGPARSPTGAQRRGRTGEAATPTAAPPEQPVKTYKPGWARPKPSKPSHPGAKRRKPGPSGEASVSAETKPYRATFGARPRPQPPVGAAASPDEPRGAGKSRSNSGGRPSGALGRIAGKRPKPSGPKSGGPRSGGPRSGGPRSGGGKDRPRQGR